VVPDYLSEMKLPVTSLRLGVPRVQFYDKLDADIEAAVLAALGRLRPLTASVTDVELPAIVSLPTLVGAETYAYHAPWFTRSPHLYQAPLRRRLEQAAKASAADYALGRREIDRLRREIGRVFQDVDLLITPTVKLPPRTLEETIKRTEAEKPLPPELGNTSAFNLFGLPTVSVPCGFTKAGLPVGLQISGPQFGEARVLALAHAYEKATEWHKRRPALNARGEGK
jgi:aspartyl-tRNA(Asn)/glutamyl-tRNA(Gln) amidotransferase subunit A